MPERFDDVVYGRYVIRALAAPGRVRVRAFLGRRAVGDAEGPSVGAALDVMRSKLDERDVHQCGGRLNGVPTAAEYCDAFTRLDAQIGPHHWLMLKALLAAPGQTLTATEIASAAGYASLASANVHFGALARLIAENLDYAPDVRADGTTIWTMALATGADVGAQQEDAHRRWALRPEVAACLRAMNVG